MEPEQTSATRRARRYARFWARLERLPAPLRLVVRGVWLGFLDGPDLAAVDELFYGEDKLGYYTEPAYVRGGPLEWERPLFDTFLPREGRVLVTAVGAGREALALRDRGLEVDASESNPALRAAGADFGIEIQAQPRNHAPRADVTYDALVVGWGSYASISTRAARIAFLAELRALAARPGVPVLLSFPWRSPRDPKLLMLAAVASLVRLARRRPRAAVGDFLGGTFTHRFTRAEAAAELAAGGFELVAYGTRGCGHAVGRAA